MNLIAVIHAFNKDSLSIYYELFIIIIYYLFVHYEFIMSGIVKVLNK